MIWCHIITSAFKKKNYPIPQCGNTVIIRINCPSGLRLGQYLLIEFSERVLWFFRRLLKWVRGWRFRDNSFSRDWNSFSFKSVNWRSFGQKVEWAKGCTADAHLYPLTDTDTADAIRADILDDALADTLALALALAHITEALEEDLDLDVLFLEDSNTDFCL